MAGVNKVIIVGRLGNEPEMRTMPNGESVANLSVATSESWTDKKYRRTPGSDRMAPYRILSPSSGSVR